MKNINLISVIQARISFIETNTIFDRDEYKYEFEGELKAYNEILEDIDTFSVNDFVEKYLQIVKDLAISFDNNKFVIESELDMWSGYNNAIIFVLSLIDPKYEYADGI